MPKSHVYNTDLYIKSYVLLLKYLKQSLDVNIVCIEIWSKCV